MKIDIGLPSEYGVSGIDKRIGKMNAIKKIPFGINLDLGTGTGAYFPKLKRYSKKIFAFDGELNYLKEFPENNKTDFNKIFVSNSEKISLKDKTFDSVFAIEVLEHVNNLQATLKEVHRILKPEGYFYFSVPNKYFPLETHMVHFGNFFVKGRYVPFLSMFDFIHKKIGTTRRFGEKDVHLGFTKYGFVVIGIEYMMPPFDYFKFGKKFIKKFSDKLENSYLKNFSMTLIAVLKKV